MKKSLLAIQVSAVLFLFAALDATSSGELFGTATAMQDTSGIKRYSPPFPSKENMPVGPGYQRWVTRNEFAFVNLTLMSGSDVMQADLLKLNHRIFNVSLMSVIDGHDPYAATYFLPFGARASLLNARYFNITAGADLYLFPFGTEGAGRGSYYEGDYNFGSRGVEEEVTFPRFVDARLSIETSPFLGIKGFIGCRIPVTPYSIYNLTAERMEYERGSPNFYIGVSGSLQFIFPFKESVFNRCYNERESRLRNARKSDSPTAYENIINTYPGTPYADEASQRLEYLLYSRAMLGNIDRCSDYLTKYPEGKYRKTVKTRINLLEEEGAYLKAIKGSVREMDTFMIRYPYGKYAGYVRIQRNKILEQIEYRAYQGAVNGTFDSCDVYIARYPEGRYIAEVKAARTEKLAVAEEGLYRDAVNGSFIECDRYLKYLPGGKYAHEIGKKRDLKYREAEIGYYKKAVSGSLVGCNEYIMYYPAGKYIAEINSLRKELVLKFRDEVTIAADRYSSLIMMHLLKSDSDSRSTAGYVISREEPFVLNVNRDRTPETWLQPEDSVSGGRKGIQHRSMGRIPASIGEYARLLTWIIAGTLVGIDDDHPVTVILDQNGFMDTSELRILLKTAHISTEGWLLIEGIRFELKQGAIDYTDVNSPGRYHEESVILANGTSLVFRNRQWTIEE